MINKAILVGWVGQDPELKSTNGGKSIVNFSLATSKKWKDQSGNKQEKTEWHRVVFFGSMADNVAKLLSKGCLVYVEGELQTRSWEGDDQVKRYTTEIIGKIFTLLESKNSKQGQSRESAMDISQDQYKEDGIPY